MSEFYNINSYDEKFYNEERNKHIKCLRCKGVGLIKREIELQCEDCEKELKKFCSFCDIIENKTLWLKCFRCSGTGIKNFKISKPNQTKINNILHSE